MSVVHMQALREEVSTVDKWIILLLAASSAVTATRAIVWLDTPGKGKGRHRTGIRKRPNSATH